MSLTLTEAEARGILGEQVQLSFAGRTAKNRILKAPLTERICDWDKEDIGKRGKPNAAYLRLYEEFGKSQYGVLVFGNVLVHPQFLEGEGNAIICRENTFDAVEAFKPVISAAKTHGSLAVVQISHPGRQCCDRFTSEPLCPSDNEGLEALGSVFAKSRAMTIEEIDNVIERFAYTAEKLYQAGADGVQLHAAHGYLLSQFLAPDVNRRTDKYGGSIENRIRIILEILAKIREKVPDPKFILAIKINSADYQKGGFSVDDCKLAVEALEGAGVDLIELSGGRYENLAMAGAGDAAPAKESTKKREAYFLEFAAQIIPHVKKTKIAVTGGFRTVVPMATAIQEKRCDFVGVGRPTTGEFEFCKDILSGKIENARANPLDAGLQVMLSISQMHAMGKNGEKGINPTQDGSMEQLMQFLGKFHLLMSKFFC